MPVQNHLIAPFSTLNLHLRLHGGGGDGGATGAESRDCYLNMYAVKKPDKVDPNEMRLSKWLNCSLSNEPLRQSVVIDKLGNLFNKEPLVEALFNKEVKELWEKMVEDAKVEDNGKKSKKLRNGEEMGRLTGSKHGIEGNVIQTNAKGSTMKFKGANVAPANATAEVYASIFTSSKKSDFKETFTCRSLPLWPKLII